MSDSGGKRKVSDYNVPVVSQPVLSYSDTSSLMTAEGRKEWGRSIEFILTLIGFCVGLGNVWRFPYLAYQNGGGAFLIPYFITLILVGIPMYFMEMSVGQFASLGPISMWKISPMFKGLGYAMVIVAAYIVCYYNVIVAWCLFYFFASMTSQLPWQYCDNWWNTPSCVDASMNISDIVMNGTLNGTIPTTPSEEYYYNNVLRLSEGIDVPGTIVWQLAALLFVAWLIIFIVLLNGVDSVGKAAYFVSLFPYLLLTILLIQAAMLDGSLDGVKYYMTPQWERLAEPKAWSDAATQIFYSLGICMGSLIAMASFNKFNNNCLRDSIMIPIINCLTSVYAGFVVFCMLGYIAKEKNVGIDEVAKDGPGLVFVVYPEGLATLPVAPLWASLFFFMMSTLGFSSQFSMAEGVCAAIEDEFPVIRKGRNGLLLRGGYCMSNFLLGLPMVTEGGFYLFKIMDDYTAGYTTFTIALFEIMAISWVYGYKTFAADIELMLGKKPNIYWIACWVAISPLVTLGVFIFKGIGQAPLTFEDYVYPGWANAIAWLIVAFPILCIFTYMIYWHFVSGGGEVCVSSNKPAKNWGPALKEHRTGHYERTTHKKRDDDFTPLNELTDGYVEKDELFTVTSIQPPGGSLSAKSVKSTTSSGKLNMGFAMGDDDVMIRRMPSTSSKGSSIHVEVATQF